MKIEYTFKEVKPNIFAVIVPNNYDLAMLFCRVQEFYESNSELFNGKDFSIWDFMKWYSDKNKGVFTYTRDWVGFNVPFNTAFNCMRGVESKTPYDIIMLEILDRINGNYWDAYIIGAESENSETFQHELCHGLYYTNNEYKMLADNITIKINAEHSKIFTDNLLKLGYSRAVIADEIQAHMMTEYDLKYFSRGSDEEYLKELHNKYKQSLNTFL